MGSEALAEYIKAVEHQGPPAARTCAELLTRTYASLGELDHRDDVRLDVGASNGATDRWVSTLCNGSPTTLKDLRAQERARWRSVQWLPEAGTQIVISAFRRVDPLWSDVAIDLTRSNRISWSPAEHWAGGMCANGPDGVWLTTPPPTDLLGLSLLAHELGHAIHQTLWPNSPTDPVHSESMAIACERWVMRSLLSNHADLSLARSVHAWLQAREADLLERHSMLHRFEQSLFRAWQETGALSADQINATWLRHSAAFFGPMVQLPPSFATAWIQVQHLFLQPHTLWAYPVAWKRSSRVSDSASLRRLMRSACIPCLPEAAA